MKTLIDTVKNYEKIKSDLNKPPEILEAEKLEERARELRMKSVNQEGLTVLTCLAGVLDIIDSSKSSYNKGLGRSRLISAAWALAEHYEIDLGEHFQNDFIK